MVAGDIEARRSARRRLSAWTGGARHRHGVAQQQLAHRGADGPRQQADERPRPRQQAIRLQRQPRRDRTADVIADPAKVLRVRERVVAAGLLQVRAPSVQDPRGVGDRRPVREGAERVRGALEGVLAVGAQRLAIPFDQRRGVADRVERQPGVVLRHEAGRRGFEAAEVEEPQRRAVDGQVASPSRAHRALAQVPVGDVVAGVAQDGTPGTGPGARSIQRWSTNSPRSTSATHWTPAATATSAGRRERRLPPHREEAEVVGAGCRMTCSLG